MQKKLFFIVIILILLFSGCSRGTPIEPVPRIAAPYSATQSFTQGTLSEFSWKVLSLSYEDGKNSLLFPLPMASVLVSAQSAANATNASRVGVILGQDASTSDAAMQQRMSALRTEFTASTHSTLRTNWELLIGPKTSIREDFLQLCREKLHLNVFFEELTEQNASKRLLSYLQENFPNATENLWAARGNPQPLMLTSAWAEPLWQEAFTSGRTLPSNFYYADATSKAVPMISALERCGVYLGKDASVAILPMAADELRLVLMLPPANVTIADFLPSIHENYSTWLVEALWEDQRVVFPPIRISTTGSMIEPFKSLGAGFIFQDGAFPGAGQLVSLSDSLYAFSLNIHEENAVTTPEGSIRYYRPGVKDAYKTLLIDRPYVFALQNTQSGTILCAGVLCDPLLK